MPKPIAIAVDFLAMVMFERNLPELFKSEDKLLRYIADYWQEVLDIPSNQNCSKPSQMFFTIGLEKNWTSPHPFLEDIDIHIETYPQDSSLRWYSVHLPLLKDINIQFETCPQDSAPRWYNDHFPKVYTREELLIKLVTVIIKSGLGYDKNHLPIPSNKTSEIKTADEIIDYLIGRDSYAF